MERKIEKLGILNRKFANLDDAHNRCIAYREGIIAEQAHEIKGLKTIIALMINNTGSKSVIMNKKMISENYGKFEVLVTEANNFAIRATAVDSTRGIRKANAGSGIEEGES